MHRRKPCTRAHIETRASSSSAPSDARLPKLVVTLPLFIVVQDLLILYGFQHMDKTTPGEDLRLVVYQPRQQQ